jgi:hypothetical protein
MIESALRQLAWEFHDKCYRREPVDHMIELITVLAPTMMEFTFDTLARLKSRRESIGPKSAKRFSDNPMRKQSIP